MGERFKKEFKKIERTMIPTRNPNIPPHVRQDKEIKDLIIEKSEGVIGLEEELFSPDDVEDDEDIEAE